MQFPGKASWQVRFEASSLPLHSALFVREACGVPVTHDVAPPLLLMTPPPAPVQVSATDWEAWWSALAASDSWAAWDPRSLAPAGLAQALDQLGNEPFEWVAQHVREVDRYREPAFSLPVLEAVTELEHELGRRSLMDVGIEGLAVQSDWVEVSGDGSVVCASWAALDHARDWLTDALRPAFRRAPCR